MLLIMPRIFKGMRKYYRKEHFFIAIAVWIMTSAIGWLLWKIYGVQPMAVFYVHLLKTVVKSVGELDIFISARYIYVKT